MRITANEYKIQTTLHHGSEIEQRAFDPNGQEICSRIVKIMDDQAFNALIEMGWTPPSVNNKV